MYISPFFNYKEEQPNRFILYNELTGNEITVPYYTLQLLIESFNNDDFNPIKNLDLPGILFQDRDSCREYLFDIFEKQRQHFPYVEQAELTNVCPYNCIMCPRTFRMTRKLGYMDFDIFQDICKQISSCQRFLSLHHFGESLIHPLLPDFVSFANSCGLYTGLSCNAASMTKELALALQKSKLSSITFCIDSLNNSRYQRIRGTRKTLKENLAMIENFIHISGSFDSPTLVSLQMIQMRENKDEGLNFLEFAQKLNVDSARVIRFGQWDFSDENAYQMADLSARALYKPACPVRWKSICILWNGDVVPCCRDYNGDIVLGNLGQTNLHEIWQSDIYLKLRKNEDHFQRCRNCWASWRYKENKRQELGFLEFHRQKKVTENYLEWLADGVAERYNAICFPVEFRVANL